MTRIGELRQKYRTVKKSLNERSRRLWAVTEAEALGHGGASLVARATGISRSTIVRGMREARSGESPEGERIRRPGAGRKRATVVDRDLLAALDRLVDPESGGDPDCPLRWTSKSTRQLAAELSASGHPASDWLVRRLLRDLGCDLHAHRKTLGGGWHPDRDAQFRYVHGRVQHQLRRRQPAIWVDVRREVRAPARDRAWVSVGVDDATASFAMNTVLRWWKEAGSKLRPRAGSLLIVARRGSREVDSSQCWNWELQRLADATRLTVHVCHLPRGTWRWNAIEQHLCSFTVRRKGRQPLPAHSAIVGLILGGQEASRGPTSRCVRDGRRYPMDARAARSRAVAIRLTPDSFHGDWNYCVRPRDPRAPSGARARSAARGRENGSVSHS